MWRYVINAMSIDDSPSSWTVSNLAVVRSRPRRALWWTAGSQTVQRLVCRITAFRRHVDGGKCRRRRGGILFPVGEVSASRTRWSLADAVHEWSTQDLLVPCNVVRQVRRVCQRRWTWRNLERLGGPTTTTICHVVTAHGIVTSPGRIRYERANGPWPVITCNWCRKRVPLWVRRVGRDLLLCIIRLWNVGGA